MRGENTVSRALGEEDHYWHLEKPSPFSPKPKPEQSGRHPKHLLFSLSKEEEWEIINFSQAQHRLPSFFLPSQEKKYYLRLVPAGFGFFSFRVFSGILGLGKKYMGKLGATVTKLRTHMGRKKYEKEKKRTRGLITPKKEGGIKRKGGN